MQSTWVPGGGVGRGVVGAGTGDGGSGSARRVGLGERSSLVERGWGEGIGEGVLAGGSWRAT